MTDKQQKANIVCCETCSHREVCYEVITNTDYDFKGYGCLRYCVSPLVIRNNARKETIRIIQNRLVGMQHETLKIGRKIPNFTETCEMISDYLIMLLEVEE